MSDELCGAKIIVTIIGSHTLHHHCIIPISQSHPLGLHLCDCSFQWPVISSESKPGIVEAAIKLSELKKIMENIRFPLPQYLEGQEPSASNNCKQILDMMDFGIKQLAAYLDVPLP